MRALRGRLASIPDMSFLDSLVRYFDGRERESTTGRFRGADAPGGTLGPGLSFKGEISGEGDLFIAGSFEGEINVTGTVRVGEDAEVEANITAGMIVVAGVVRGNISASTHVEMLPSGTLTGTVKYQACDDRVCFPPQSIPLSWTIGVKPLDRERAR